MKTIMPQYGDNIFRNNSVKGNTLCYNENPFIGSNQPIQPEPDAIMWRYMNYEKFSSLLNCKSLFFSLVSVQSDEYEGYMTPLPDNGTAPNLIEFLRAHLVSCWTLDVKESFYMWDNFVRQEQEGVVISTNFKDFKESIFKCNQELDTKISFGKVEYVDYTEQEKTYPSWGPLFHLRKKFSKEQEVRAILPPPWNLNDPYNSWNLDPDVKENKGRNIPVCLETLVKEIIVSPKSSNEFFEQVKSDANNSLPNVKVRSSTLSDRLQLFSQLFS